MTDREWLRKLQKTDRKELCKYTLKDFIEISQSAFLTSRVIKMLNLLKTASYMSADLLFDFYVLAYVYRETEHFEEIMTKGLFPLLKYSPENDNVDIAAIANDNYFRIAVHDNGIGIDPKYHGKIFAKFVQLDNAYTKKESSTGLGVTITKELTELHGGKVSIISEVNNGSTFIVEIPC